MPINKKERDTKRMLTLKNIWITLLFFTFKKCFYPILKMLWEFYKEILCFTRNGFYTHRKLTGILNKCFCVKRKRKNERKYGNEKIYRTNQPKPRPIFKLALMYSHRHFFKKFRAKHCQKITYCIIFAGSPYLRGIFISYCEEIGVIS